ncbi:aKG-HExxH-type peptide beta-hydroxylase [Streptomyces sp. NPDC053431]|uniref:aKG-HExxH-type peptide beta-hydroxylase n=1 Tax=Streptomyces sp. NPDC053431 TaxID=3365703 RepID=UPI0037D94C61
MQTDGRHEPARTVHHLIPSAHFDALAAGRGGPDTIRFLRTTEYSRRLLLLRALLDEMARTPGALGPLPSVDSAWDTLTAAQEHAPEEFRALLLHPQTGVWLGHGLRRLRHTGWGDGPLWTDLGHLFAICAVAALRAGLTLHTTVPLRDGAAMFPTLGLARLPGRPRWGTAEVAVESGRLRVDPHGAGVGPAGGPPLDGDAPGWQGLRRLHAYVTGRRLEVWLDDVDPFRDLSEPLPPERLGASEVACWQDRFGRALALLEDSDPEMAAALAEGLRSMTAVAPSPRGLVLSASSGDAFGGMLTSLPPDPVTMAVTLVHEFQHTKLGALLHLLTLEEDGGAERHHAPWRDDPRPLSGLLQGAYAFLGITDFWSRYLDRAPLTERARAEFEFALSRRQTGEAVDTLAADPALTAHGRRFVAGMAARLSSWATDIRVRPAVDALAEFAATDHRTEWRIRHLVPAPDDVRALARAYVTGARAADCPVGTRSVTPDPARWPHARTALIHQVLDALTAADGRRLARLDATSTDGARPDPPESAGLDDGRPDPPDSTGPDDSRPDPPEGAGPDNGHPDPHMGADPDDSRLDPSESTGPRDPHMGAGLTPGRPGPPTGADREGADPDRARSCDGGCPGGHQLASFKGADRESAGPDADRAQPSASGGDRAESSGSDVETPALSDGATPGLERPLPAAPYRPGSSDGGCPSCERPGYSGSSGPSGSPGSPGPSGSLCSTGSTDFTGSSGPSGSTSPSGSTDPSGSTGFVGWPGTPEDVAHGGGRARPSDVKGPGPSTSYADDGDRSGPSNAARPDTSDRATALGGRPWPIAPDRPSPSDGDTALPGNRPRPAPPERPRPSPPERPQPSDADRALVTGDPAAPDAYARLLAGDPEAPEAWTGLVLALANADPTTRPLLRRPELLRAVHRELRAIGTAADPRDVARWLAGTADGGT